MDIKQGHPGAVFSWFFDTDQGSDQRAQLLLMLYGSDAGIRKLTRDCLERQEEFNDVLGPEILFLFFDPETSVTNLSEDGAFLRGHLRREGSARFLFARYGEARAVPPNLIEIGRTRFRSEDPSSCHFSEIAAAAARANSRAIPFFQQAFELQPLRNNLIFCHRKERQIILYDLGNPVTLTSNDLLNLLVPVRKIARHSKGAADLAAIDDLISGRVQHAQIRAMASKSWDFVRTLAKGSV